ncbi:MAG: GDP-mannose 4,6-dehydratase [Verrucomicrobia bacterium]|nr:GDP-mannose 4,6-dehydratase [Verrucomicrobiota bacterium]
MRILITGGAGFIGSHLAEACLRDGDEVTVLDDLSTGRMENLAAVRGHARFHFAQGSILDATVVERLVGGADLVYHLAAAVGVRLVVRTPLQTIITNVEGTQVVLENCAQHGRKVFLASTSEVYGKSRKAAFAESDELILGPTSVGRWAYACAKALDEFLAFGHAKERGLRFVAVRYFNTVGPRQVPEHGMVVPRFISQALKNEPVTVFGDGTQSRCFIHVHDAVTATRLLANNPDAEGEVVNVGDPRPVAILELARKVLRLTGSSSVVQHVDPKRVYDTDFEDMENRVPDIAKLKRLTGFSPEHSLDQAIQDAIAVLREGASR